MHTITWLLLLAALLPLVATVAAKGGDRSFDNNNPRQWLATRQGWRARANAAQINSFENLPFFFAAVFWAIHNQADSGVLIKLMIAWLVVRLLYIAAYLAGKGSVRSLVWSAALAINISILFAAGR